jgi:hypothetical protein
MSITTLQDISLPYREMLCKQEPGYLRTAAHEKVMRLLFPATFEKAESADYRPGSPQYASIRAEMQDCLILLEGVRQFYMRGGKIYEYEAADASQVMEHFIQPRDFELSPPPSPLYIRNGELGALLFGFCRRNGDLGFAVGLEGAEGWSWGMFAVVPGEPLHYLTWCSEGDSALVHTIFKQTAMTFLYLYYPLQQEVTEFYTPKKRKKARSGRHARQLRAYSTQPRKVVRVDFDRMSTVKRKPFPGTQPPPKKSCPPSGGQGASTTFRGGYFVGPHYKDVWVTEENLTEDEKQTASDIKEGKRNNYLYKVRRLANKRGYHVGEYFTTTAQVRPADKIL